MNCCSVKKNGDSGKILVNVFVCSTRGGGGGGGIRNILLIHNSRSDFKIIMGPKQRKRQREGVEMGNLRLV